MDTINLIISIVLIMLLASWATWSAVNYPKTKKLVFSGKRVALIKDYIYTIVGLAVFGGIALIVCGNKIFVVPEIYFVDNSEFLKISIYVIAATLVVYQTGSSVALRKHNDKIPQNISAFLPLARNEKLMFAVVCLFAGVCEELVFRGFALIFLEQFEINIWLAIFVSSLIFGLMHLYQGFTGLLTSFLMGILLTMLFAVSGNLLLPIIIHFVTDICNVIIKKEVKYET